MSPAHSHTLVRVVVRLVAHGDFLLPDLLEQLAVGSHTHRAVFGQGVVLEHSTHAVEQTDHSQCRAGGLGLIHPLQQKTGVLVPLRRRLRQPVLGPLRIAGNLLACEIQLFFSGGASE